MRKAFTLLELLVVLFLISLTASLIIPKITRNFSLYRNFATEFEELLIQARMKAIINNLSYFLIFDSENRRIFVSSNLSALSSLNNSLIEDLKSQINVPEEFEIKAEHLINLDDYKLIFFLSSGLSSGGIVEIIDLNYKTQNIFYVPKSQWLIYRETNY